MLEISWFGRGGQGAFTAARLLANAYVLKGEGAYALAFPTFGPERRGAPVKAFTKLSDAKIADRGETLASDFAVFLDESLFDAARLPLLKEGGRVIVNSKKEYGDSRVLAFDADGIAVETLGLPIANTVMIGALAALMDAVPLAEIDAAIDRNMPERLRAGNKAAVRAAAAAVAERSKSPTPSPLPPDAAQKETATPPLSFCAEPRRGGVAESSRRQP